MDSLENENTSYFSFNYSRSYYGSFFNLFLDEKWIDPENIFAGKTMYYFVSLSVGVILFEGGLTLKFKEVRQLAGVVRNLLIVGPIVMGIGGAISCSLFFEWIIE